MPVVVPLRDEEAVFPMLAARLTSVLDTVEGPWEVVFVDDGSDRPPASLWRGTRPAVQGAALSPASATRPR